MSSKYTRPSCESIVEDSEDESEDELRERRISSLHHNAAPPPPPPPPRPPLEASMKGSYRKEKARARRTSKSSAGSSKHGGGRPNMKNLDPRRPVGIYPSEINTDVQSTRRHHSHSKKSSASPSSSEGEEAEEDHREVLAAAARARLTSPSTLSSLTTETTATNQSGSSSGSNSTVTQLSVGKRSPSSKQPEILEPGEDNSPAAPDPPDVFEFIDPRKALQQDDDVTDERDDQDECSGGDDETESGDEASDGGGTTPPTPPLDTALETAPVPTRSPRRKTSNSTPERAVETASSSSGSFHGDDTFSEPAVDNDSDRSSSPDSQRSPKGRYHQVEAPPPPPADHVSDKIRSQMAAAQQRQHYAAMHQYGVPEMPRGSSRPPRASSTVSSSHSSTVSTARYQPPFPPQVPQQYPVQAVQAQPQYALQRFENLPITGYELLAMRLSSDEKGPRIRPMYRKFEALNHRLLLHLQDELSELEEQLRRLDLADTQARCSQSQIMPASRRLSAQAGGQLEWCKVDILGKIGYKIAQYNQALASFNQTQALAPPDAEEVHQYRAYLQNERPIDDSETHFLDPADDLVSLCAEPQRSSSPHSSSSSSSNVSSRVSEPSRRSCPRSPRSPPFSPMFSPAMSHSHMSNSHMAASHLSTSTASSEIRKSTTEPTTKFQTLALSLTICILLPILTFIIVPSFIARITITILVALGMTGALVHTGMVKEMDVSFEREGIMYLGLYVGVMGMLAGTVS